MSDEQDAADADDEAALRELWSVEYRWADNVTYHDADKRDSAPGIRRHVEHFVFGGLAEKPKEQQVEALGGILASATELDERTALLRGAITQMSAAMPREQVWRVLQAFADSYRCGEPLQLVDRCLLLADDYLDREVIAAAYVGVSLEDTKGKARKQTKERISKARDDRAPRLADAVEVDARDRFPLLATLARVAADFLGVRVETIADPPQPVAEPEQRLPSNSNR